ncbi:hypothetical protein RB595_000409 [Gaeumannomyces hyphopodioides]
MAFACEHPACGRTYLRKEHLTRHTKIHDAVRAFECPKCDAKFSRGDTLRRHMQLHGPRASAPAQGRVSRACLACHGSKTRCDGAVPSCAPCAERGRSCTYPATSNSASQRDPKPRGEPDSNQRPAVASHGSYHRAPDVSLREASPTKAPMGATTTSHAISEHLLDIYFSEFHSSWPVIRRHTVTGRPQPRSLLRTIGAIALFFDGRPESRTEAIQAHNQLLEEAQHEAGALLIQARMGAINSPTEDLLPRLQYILLCMILCAYRPDKSIDIPLEMKGAIVELFKLIGVYEQSKIWASIPLQRDDYYPLLARDSYQRLGLLHYKLHLLLNIRLIKIFPWKKFDHSLNPSVLNVSIPMHKAWWDREPQCAGWTAQMEEALAGVSEGDLWGSSGSSLTISAMVPWMAGAGEGGGPAALPVAFLAFDKYLALAVHCWCARPEGEPDAVFVGRINALIYAPIFPDAVK